jgi:hypothetical protein
MMPPPPGPPGPPGGAACNASGAAFIIGQPATPPNVEAARQSASASTVRIIRPGQPVTMDFNFRRLNLEVNNFNFITNATCG